MFGGPKGSTDSVIKLDEPLINDKVAAKGFAYSVTEVMQASNLYSDIM